MSGGTAYVLDLHETRLNSEMVDLETLDPEDVELVRHLVGRHVETTDSPVASALLDAWRTDPDGTTARFAKIMPRDYKAVLTAKAAALEEGLDVDGPETLARIMEASHG
jgi:glutamate synthase (NADPH/NADH) large chain